MEVGSQETVDGFRDEFQYNFSDLEAGVRVSVLFQKVGHGVDWVVQHEASGLVHSSKHFRTLFRESGTVEEVVGDRLFSFGVEAANAKGARTPAHACVHYVCMRTYSGSSACTQ